jgi:hypothetical protein
MAFKRIFPESHFNAYDFLRLTGSNIAGDLLQARAEHVLMANVASVIRFRLAQFWGTYQGYRRSSAVTQALRQRLYYPRGMESRPENKRAISPIRYNHGSGRNDGHGEQ